jgi:hypothetical protein
MRELLRKPYFRHREPLPEKNFVPEKNFGAVEFFAGANLLQASLGRARARFGAAP